MSKEKTYNGNTVEELEFIYDKAYVECEGKTYGIVEKEKAGIKAVAEACLSEMETCECGAIFPKEWEIVADEDGAILCPRCALSGALTFYKLKWISLDEWLPEPMKNVLTLSVRFGRHEIMDAFWCDEQRLWLRINHCNLNENKVTHWQPLPEPPKES